MSFNTNIVSLEKLGAEIVQSAATHETAVHSLLFLNTSGMEQSFKLYLKKNGAETGTLMFEKTMTAGEIFTFPKVINLAPMDSIYAEGSTLIRVTASFYSQNVDNATGLTFNIQGVYDAEKTYTRFDIVNLNGTSYVATTSGLTTPPPSAGWEVMAEGTEGVGAIDDTAVTNETTWSSAKAADYLAPNIIGTNTGYKNQVLTWTLDYLDSFSVYEVSTLGGDSSVVMNGKTIEVTCMSTAGTFEVIIKRNDAERRVLVTVLADSIIPPVFLNESQLSSRDGIVLDAFLAAPVGDDTHTSTTWQVAKDESFTVLMYESVEDTENLTTLPKPLSVSDNTLYAVRAKFNGVFGSSEWSEPMLVEWGVVNNLVVTDNDFGEYAGAYSNKNRRKFIGADGNEYVLQLDYANTTAVVPIGGTTSAVSAVTATVLDDRLEVVNSTTFTSTNPYGFVIPSSIASDGVNFYVAYYISNTSYYSVYKYDTTLGEFTDTAMTAGGSSNQYFYPSTSGYLTGFYANNTNKYVLFGVSGYSSYLEHLSVHFDAANLATNPTYVDFTSASMGSSPGSNNYSYDYYKPYYFRRGNKHYIARQMYGWSSTTNYRTIALYCYDADTGTDWVRNFGSSSYNTYNYATGFIYNEEADVLYMAGYSTDYSYMYITQVKGSYLDSFTTTIESGSTTYYSYTRDGSSYSIGNGYFNMMANSDFTQLLVSSDNYNYHPLTVFDVSETGALTVSSVSSSDYASARLGGQHNFKLTDTYYGIIGDNNIAAVGDFSDAMGTFNTLMSVDNGVVWDCTFASTSTWSSASGQSKAPADYSGYMTTADSTYTYPFAIDETDKALAVFEAKSLN